jgi:hypothetical protein
VFGLQAVQSHNSKKHATMASERMSTIIRDFGVPAFLQRFLGQGDGAPSSRTLQYCIFFASLFLTATRLN